MFSTIQPQQFVALRLPSDNIRVEQIIPNTVINLGKFGSFQTNQIINQPFYLTFEILDRSQQQNGRQLRVISANELHAETLLEEDEPDILAGSGENGSTSTPSANTFDEFGLPSSTEKSNVNIIDDPTMQKLTADDIEALKADGTSNPKDLIAKIMASHSQIDQKTAFSLAKYILRKQKKYMKRFTVLPMDVPMLADWLMNEKDFAKIMEIRNEMLGLMSSWGNIHASGPVGEDEEPRSRYLVVDDTGGLIVAALAERMGILHHETTTEPPENDLDEPIGDAVTTMEESTNTTNPSGNSMRSRRRQLYTHDLAISNTLTLIHANQQPNLHLLRYFSYDPNAPVSPAESNPHPLYTHLKTLTWLQLLQPSADTSYSNEPPHRSSEDLAQLKSNQRSTYHRKRRRWTRCKAIVDETRSGGFDGLIVASYMEARGIVRHLVPLLKGGAQIVVYYPHIEPLMDLCDMYGTARRTAFLNLSEEDKALLEEAWEWTGEDTPQNDSNGTLNGHAGDNADEVTKEDAVIVMKEKKAALLNDFPVDPTLTLGFMLQTSRARPWQVLPGRTHPLMMGKGGAEGYLAVGTRVLPIKGQTVAARGRNRQRPKNKNARTETLGTPGNDDGMLIDDAKDEQDSKRTKTEHELVE